MTNVSANERIRFIVLGTPNEKRNSVVIGGWPKAIILVKWRNLLFS
jgi:hypothetical protein